MARSGPGHRALSSPQDFKAEETKTSTELRTLQWLASLEAEHPGAKRIRRLENNFIVHGPNGDHAYSVNEVAGSGLYDVYNVAGHGYTAGSRRLRADLAHAVARQVVQAVDFMHSQQICHGGNATPFLLDGCSVYQSKADLTLSNVLLALKPLDSWAEDDIYNAFGTPSTVDLVPAPDADVKQSAPPYIVEPARTPGVELLTGNALLVEFSESFPFAQPPRPENIGIPLMYRAPETIFEAKLNPAAESWSLACLLFEIRAGNPLFTSIMGGRDEIIQQMVQMKGKVPEPYWRSWEKGSACFDESGKAHTEWLNSIAMAVGDPLGEMIADISRQDDEAAFFGSEVEVLEPKDTVIPKDEADSMAHLLNRVLRWRPEERLSVAHVLQHYWIAQQNVTQ